MQNFERTKNQKFLVHQNNFKSNEKANAKHLLLNGLSATNTNSSGLPHALYKEYALVMALPSTSGIGQISDAFCILLMLIMEAATTPAMGTHRQSANFDTGHAISWIVANNAVRALLPD